MRPSLFIIAATLSLTVQASWFSGSSSDSTEPAYANWNKHELESWLELHHISIPSHTPSSTELRQLVEDNWNTAAVWSYDQYASAQKAFADLRETSFDKWDESALREWLLEHGVVAPKGPKEKLVLLAKAKYRDYTNAAKTLSAQASASASTAVYGDTPYQMKKSASSVAEHATASVTSAASQASAAVAQASADAARAFDQSKDYVYSTWDENQMRKWLEDKGLIKTKEQKKKDELVTMMHDAWGKVANPVYNAWGDSYLHHWLLSHHIIKSDYEKNRDDLLNKMNQYYYTTTDTVWSNWSDSQLKQWLVNQGIIKSDAQASRDKMIKMVEDNYLTARDTFWNAWTDNALKGWLIEHGYMRTDAQVKRDELIKLANEKWNQERARTQAYLTWPDARLRAYLRESGIDDSHIPSDRPRLLQETRIRWVMAENKAETLFQKIKDIVNSGVYKAEDGLLRLVHLLNGGWEETKDKANEAYDDVKARSEKDWNKAKKKGYESGEWVDDRAKDSRENVGEKVKYAGEKIKGEL